jgi:hypothetical protein
MSENDTPRLNDRAQVLMIVSMKNAFNLEVINAFKMLLSRLHSSCQLPRPQNVLCPKPSSLANIMPAWFLHKNNISLQDLCQSLHGMILAWRKSGTILAWGGMVYRKGMRFAYCLTTADIRYT